MADALDRYVHVFVPGTGEAANDTVLTLHGTGSNEHDLIPLAQAIFPGANVLSPRGNVMEGSSARFFRRHAEGVLDLEDLAVRTGELAEFIAAAAGKYGFDAGRVDAVGFSNGANIALSMLLSRPGVLRAAALLSPMLVFVPEEPLDLTGTSVFIGGGRLDPLVPIEQVEQLEQLLTNAGATVTMHLENVGHQVTDREIWAAREWASQLV